MFFSEDAYAPRAARAKELAAELSADGVRFVEMQLPDINGMMRGKIATVDKGLAASGTGVSTLIQCPRGGDELTIDFWSDFDNGFPKVVGVPDHDTLTRCSWRPDTAAVLCDFYMEDGSACPMDPRHVLRRVCAEYEALGLEPRASIEWELYLYHRDDALLRQKRYGELEPFGRGWEFYSITRYPSWEQLAKDFITRLVDSGIEIEAFHTEYGHGMYEFTCAPTHPLKAADDALRGKGYLRTLADEHGLVPTFMPALHMATADSHNGAHHNVSVWRDGRNAFWDADAGGLSQLAGRFAAGMMATMADLHLCFRPWINSHRRMDRLSWAPEDASWGPDNHAVALRVVYGALPARSTRFEHRAPGTDINPYMSLAAMLWGGLEGIRQELEPAPFAVGDPIANGDFPRLPKTLATTTATWRGSPVARELFGDPFVDHVANVREEEVADFAQWCEANGVDDDPAGAVTQWEYERYFTWA